MGKCLQESASGDNFELTRRLALALIAQLEEESHHVPTLESENPRSMTMNALTADIAMQISYLETALLAPAELRDLRVLCNAAYEEDVTLVLSEVGPGVHALGRVNDVLVSHAMIVTRELQVAGGKSLRTAYIELVATDPSHQRRGYASALLRALVTQMGDYDIAALSPSAEAFYARLGWERWRGPLRVRTAAGEEATPEDEEVMVLRLPRTPAHLDLDAPLSIESRPGEVW